MAESICPLCQGTGWVLEESKSGATAKRCKCFHKQRNQILLEQANIPRRYKECTLKNFKTSNQKHDDSKRYALKLSKKWVDDYPMLEFGLLFIGPCGVGKTHLAVAILQELILQKAVPCYFCDFRELIRNIQNSFSSDSHLTESNILAPVFQKDVLVLDELGAKRTSAWVEDTIFYIINNRYNNNKLTIFTSNYLDIEEEYTKDKILPYFAKGRKDEHEEDEDSLVKRIGVRLRSRLYEMCRIVNVSGKDYRISYQAKYGI